MAMLYSNLCYYEVCYKGAALKMYFFFFRYQVLQGYLQQLYLFIGTVYETKTPLPDMGWVFI